MNQGPERSGGVERVAQQRVDRDNPLLRHGNLEF
jgi:hypothetical protein